MLILGNLTLMDFDASQVEMLESKTQEVQKLYTAKLRAYRALITFFRSRQAIRALIESSGFLRPGLRVLDAGCGFGTATFAFAAGGFNELAFIRFPLRYFWQNLSNHVVVARRGE